MHFIWQKFIQLRPWVSREGGTFWSPSKPCSSSCSLGLPRKSHSWQPDCEDAAKRPQVGLRKCWQCTLTQEKTERKPKTIRSLILKAFSLELAGTSVMGALAENGTSETDEGYLFWRSEDILKLSQSFETAELSCWVEGEGSRWVLMPYNVSNQRSIFAMFFHDTFTVPFLKKGFYLFWASLVAQMLKNLPPVQETQVQSLGWEDPRRSEWKI